MSAEERTEHRLTECGTTDCPVEHVRAFVDDGKCSACGGRVTTRPVVTELLHSFNRETGICRCGTGPLTTPEWVAHYKAQDEPERTTIQAPVTHTDAALAEVERRIVNLGDTFDYRTKTACAELIAEMRRAIGGQR